jgi:thiamine-monophosphate kinase
VPSEFELIARHFQRPVRHTVLGVGDDGAIIRPSPGMDLVVSTDMLVAGTHFLAGTDPEALGWKALAVNLSDLAAMGAQPRWALVAAALPEADEAWLGAFARGLFSCADRFEVDIVGGDTTRGPLNLAPTVFGEVPQGQALTRAGAQAGDDLWVSGSPGLAALGLAQRQGKVGLPGTAMGPCLAALERPEPRLALGLALRGLASAAIDVSDGLLADIGHILERSALAADIGFGLLPHAALETGAEAWLLFPLLSRNFSEAASPSSCCCLRLGVSACQITGRALGVVDHGAIVWDEIVPFWLVLLFTPGTALAAGGLPLVPLLRHRQAAAGALLRHAIKNGFGVMMDDLVAAGYTVLTIAVFKAFLPF